MVILWLMELILKELLGDRPYIFFGLSSKIGKPDESIDFGNYPCPRARCIWVAFPTLWLGRYSCAIIINSKAPSGPYRTKSLKAWLVQWIVYLRILLTRIPYKPKTNSLKAFQQQPPTWIPHFILVKTSRRSQWSRCGGVPSLMMYCYICMYFTYFFMIYCHTSKATEPFLRPLFYYSELSEFFEERLKRTN